MSETTTKKPKRGRTNKFSIRIVWGGDRGGSLTIASADGKNPEFPAPDRLAVADELELFAKCIREYEPHWAKADAASEAQP